MSWAVGWDSNWGRDIGYGVPAVCDQPGCDVEIDRGLSFVCGGEPFGGEKGCGLYFCPDHLIYFGALDDDPQLCDRCGAGDNPHQPKPDRPTWVQHKLTDPSWAEWRSAHPELVASTGGAQ